MSFKPKAFVVLLTTAALGAPLAAGAASFTAASSEGLQGINGLNAPSAANAPAHESGMTESVFGSPVSEVAVTQDTGAVTTDGLPDLTFKAQTSPTEQEDGPAIYQMLAEGHSAAPEPATWAMMLAGFGGAGALLRHRRRGGGGNAYRLVESLPNGDESAEEFMAPDDATALARARAVAEGQIELWRGDVRIAPGLNA